MTPGEKENIYKKELGLIFNLEIKEFTRLCLIAAPDYIFYDAPSSSSGKYHSVDELSGNGCVIHTKRVFYVANELCRGIGCENNKDAVLSSCIIHDLVKQGFKKTGHTQRNHPDLAAQLVDKVQEATFILSEAMHSMIKNCVGYHYGIWSTGKWKKDLNDYTPEELCVYVSDYLASKKELHNLKEII